MPPGISRFGACGSGEWVASILSAVGLHGRLIFRHHVARHELKRILPGSLLPIAGSPSRVHQRDDLCSVTVDPINHSVWKSSQRALTDTRFHLSIDRRLECNALECFAEMAYESAGEFALLCSVEGGYGICLGDSFGMPDKLHQSYFARRSAMTCSPWAITTTP